MSHSSTSSSEALPAKVVGAARFLKAVALAAALVVCAELLCRLALGPLGHYWQYWDLAAAAKFEHFRERARQGRAPALLVVGDSTGASDIDPASVASQFEPGVDAYNLAWPADFPLAFRACTLPLLREASRGIRVVVASFSPRGFVESPEADRFESAILNSLICREVQGRREAAHYVYLARVRYALPFRRSWFTGGGLPGPPDRAGFMPLDGGNQEPPPARSASATEARVGIVSLSEERLRAIFDLAELGRQKGFRLVVVMPPISSDDPLVAEIERQYMSRLSSSRNPAVDVIDFRRPDFLAPTDYKDGIHLFADGARRYSEHLGQALRERLSSR
jgi:hypothetical protein